MLFEKLNYTSRTIKEGIELSKMEFRPLKDFIGQIIYVDGFFFTEGKYGKQVVVVGNGYKINLPSRFVEKFETIEGDVELPLLVANGSMLVSISLPLIIASSISASPSIVSNFSTKRDGRLIL